MKKCEKCFSNDAHRIVNGMYLCDSCAFREENIQCYKCQMYLPRAELVYWRGQLYCPYCLMDVREEELRQQKSSHTEHAQEIKHNETYHKKSPTIKNEYCQRCGTTLYTAYIINGRKLCRNCSEELKKEYKGKGLRFYPIKYKIKNKPLIVSIAELAYSVVIEIYNRLRSGNKKDKEKKEE